MMRIATAYIVAGFVFLSLDAVWLSLASGLLYRPLIGELLRPSFTLTPAALFYALYVAGIVVFAVLPARSAGRLSDALLYGAALGVVAYGTYDLTNQATLRGWSWIITIADMIWGAILTGTAAAASVLVIRTLFDRRMTECSMVRRREQSR
jgi:uncharacterized membrane protein